MYNIFRLIGFIASLTVFSLSSYAADLVIEDAWVRMPPPVSETAAIYVTFSNTGKEIIKIKSIETSSAEKTEFHSMEMHGGMMHMAEMKDVHIQAEDKLVFATGGNHLMMIGLNKQLHSGDIVQLVLKTESGTAYSFDAEVRDMRQHSQKQHGHH